MKKRDVFKYYRDIDNDSDDEESPYDFRTVDLRGENHSNDEYDEFGEFSFADDSHGVLPFDDDLELVEEDFTLPDVEEDDVPTGDDTDAASDIDDEEFVLDKPDDAPDFTEDFLEDEEEDEIAPSPILKLFNRGKKEKNSSDDTVVDVDSDSVEKNDSEPVIDTDEASDVGRIQVDAVVPVAVAPAVPRKPMPKMRNSALQPLLVINRSKHSFDLSKKRTSGVETDESGKNDFENFDDGDTVVFDDGDIEDMSPDMKTEDSFHGADNDTEKPFDDSDSTSDEEMISGENDEQIDEVVLPGAADDTDEVVDETADIIAESESSVPEIFEQNDVAFSDESIDEESVADIKEIVDDTTEVVGAHIPSGKIFFDDFNDSENIFADDDKPIFEPHTVNSMDVTKSAADAIEGAKVNSLDDGLENDSDDAADDENVVAENDAVTEDGSEVPAKKSFDGRIRELKTARKKKKQQKKVRNFVKEIFGWVGLVFAAFFIAIVINLYVARPSVVSGRSMMPTLQNGDTIIISKVPYMLGEVKYGDIVVIDRQVERDRTFTVEVAESLKYNVLTQSLFDENDLTEDIFWVKRIIGLPGDVIEFYEDKVYRNGELLSEGYIFTQNVENYPNGKQFIVQEGCVFVMGDNRNESLDSRNLAMHDEQIAMDHIVGKLISK